MAVRAGVALLLILAVTISIVVIDSLASAKPHADPRLRQFETLYEPSGAQELPDGRILIIEDENLRPFSILSINDDGEVSTRPLQTASLFDLMLGESGVRNLRDLEGIAVDDRGYVYAITSYSRTEEGKRAKTRERLIRFHVDGDKLIELREVKGLRRAITKAHPLLKDAVRVSDVKDDNGFNIEGLSFDRPGNRLLIALRSPVIDGKAVIVVMENPEAAFENGEDPDISDELILLDLDKGGIRAITFDPKLSAYWIVSRREDKKDKSFKLWSWNGAAGHVPSRTKTSIKIELENAEGITPVRVNGKKSLMIVFDDGNNMKGKGAHYLMLNYEDLNMNLR